MPKVSQAQITALRHLMPAWEVAELIGRDHLSLRSTLSQIKRKTGVQWPDFPRKCKENAMQTARRTARSSIIFEEDAWNGL